MSSSSDIIDGSLRYTQPYRFDEIRELKKIASEEISAVITPIVVKLQEATGFPVQSIHLDFSVVKSYLIVDRAALIDIDIKFSV